MEHKVSCYGNNIDNKPVTLANMVVFFSQKKPILAKVCNITTVHMTFSYF